MDIEILIGVPQFNIVVADSISLDSKASTFDALVELATYDADAMLAKIVHGKGKQVPRFVFSDERGEKLCVPIKWGKKFILDNQEGVRLCLNWNLIKKFEED